MKRPAEAGRNFIKACSDLGPPAGRLDRLDRVSESADRAYLAAPADRPDRVRCPADSVGLDYLVHRVSFRLERKINQ